jgi:Alpha/beta hydrolase family
VHLVGHSLGGWTAAEIAVRNGSHLASLCLIAPAGIRVKGVPSGDNFISSPEESARNLFYDQSFAELMLSATPSEDEKDRELTNRFMAARLGWEPRWFNSALERWLHRIQVPSFLLWGENDKFMPNAYAKRWQELGSGLRVELIADCGHLPDVEKAVSGSRHHSGLPRRKVAMWFICFHLMPYRPLDFVERAKHRSAWVVLPNTPYDPKRGAEEYQSYIDQLASAEKLGFDAIAVNEHHQTAYGMMPAPNLIDSALIQRTSTVTIAILGRALPLVEIR